MFRTEKRRNAQGRSYPWIVRSTGMVNHFYFYCLDDDFGPFFLKFCSYFPYTAKLCLNGHHWAQRQAAKAGIGFTAMDNAFAAVDDVETLQAICDALGPAQIYALLDKWLTRSAGSVHRRRPGRGLPLPGLGPAGRVLLDPDARRPVSGRVFFEHVIRDNLDVGRADKVGLIFGRRIHHGRKRSTPSPVPDPGDHRRCHPEPARRLQAHHDQAVPQGRESATDRDHHQRQLGLQTSRKGLGNLPALREIGFSANRRLLGVQRLDHDPLLGAQQLHHVIDPVVTDTGTTIPGLRLGQTRSHALLSALLTFRTQLDGFTNRDLRQLTAELRGLDPATVTTGQTTYDLRRLRSATA